MRKRETMEISNFKKLDKRIQFKTKLKNLDLIKIKPQIIFFIHWSKKVPSNNK